MNKKIFVKDGDGWGTCPNCGSDFGYCGWKKGYCPLLHEENLRLLEEADKEARKNLISQQGQG